MIVEVLIPILTGGIGIALLFVKEKSRYQKILNILLIGIATISGVYAIINVSEHKEIGSLQPVHKSIDPQWLNQKGVGIKQGEQVIKIGSSVNKPIYPFGRNIPLALTKENEGLVIFAKVTSSDGKVVARIANNKWQTNPNNYFRKFHNQSAIEIIDEYDIPVLQIEYLDYNTIKIGGIFRPERSSISEIDDDFPQFDDPNDVISIFQLGPWVQIIGEKGFLSGNSVNEMELHEFIGTSKSIIKPWFDYSDPSKPSRKLQK